MTHERERMDGAAMAEYAGLPAAQGLYDPRNEHDACGIGFVANIHNIKSHKLVEDGLRILENLEHRGAVGADPKAGDGAGILIQIPTHFSARKRRSSALICQPKDITASATCSCRRTAPSGPRSAR